MRNLGLCILFGLASAETFAASGGGSERISLGLGLGTALKSEGGFGQTLELKGGYRVFPLIATSLYYWRTSSGADVSQGSASYSTSTGLTAFGVEGLYNFAGTNWSGGLKLGLMKYSRDASYSDSPASASLSDSKSSISLSPTVAYEVAMGSMAFGGEGAYFYSLSSSVPKALSLMALVRYRF